MLKIFKYFRWSAVLTWEGQGSWVDRYYVVLLKEERLGLRVKGFDQKIHCPGSLTCPLLTVVRMVLLGPKPKSKGGT